MRFLLVILLAFSLPAQADADRLNPNLASKAELAALPGSGDALADAIIAARPYLTAAAFAAAVELDDDAREALFTQVFRPVNLNTASEAELLLIPGMTKRMAHEFEEYRPYRDIEQFRREIGKYVDDDEVARLESYVTLD